MTGFPKILLISKTLINDVDSAGASLRNWFNDWPKDHLAQLYSGVGFESGAFCSCKFQIGPEERLFGKIFSRLKASPLGDAGQPLRRTKTLNDFSNRKWWQKTIYNTGKLLTRSGLWEIVFPPRLSKRLNEWIMTFKPDVLFVQGCDISFMRLSLMIQRSYGIPVCFNIVDDWVEHLYEESFVAPLIQNVVRHSFRRLAEVSTNRYTIGNLMAEEYQERYGLSFTPLMQCDDVERFKCVKSVRERDWKNINIVYSGTLSLNRWRSFIHLAKAAEGLQTEGVTIKIMIYAPFIPAEAWDKLHKLPAITLHNALTDKDVPKALSDADILFLPESFDESIRAYIKLSVSTKAHLYMMAGRPILVYGPPEIATVVYAKREKWGYVVENEEVNYLSDALRKLLKNKELRDALVMKGKSVAAQNHHGKITRERLRNDLWNAAHAKKGSICV
jgi:glycosyltransferase involved in cell wall biosynthesis